MRRCLPLVLASCVQPQPAPQAPPPPAVTVEYEMHGQTGGESAHDVEPTRVEATQPAHVRLKLGHYRNSRVGVGVTIDRISAATDNIADVDPALLRFDGEDKIWLLEGRPGAYGRTEYVRERGRVMLVVSREGRFTLFVPDPVTGRASDAIDVHRDGDAEPLTINHGEP